MTTKFKIFREISNNFFMGYLEIRFLHGPGGYLVVIAIEHFMNFLKKQRELPKFVRASHRHQPIFKMIQGIWWAVGVTQNVTSPSSPTPPAIRPILVRQVAI